MSHDAGRRGTARRAGMTLGWTAVIFVVLQLGLASAAEFWLPWVRDSEYAIKAVPLCRRARHPRHEAAVVVMLGSSRTIYGLKAKELEDRLAQQLGRPVVIFNFGIVGGGPVTELLTLKRLLAAGVHPDLLLIEVLPPMLAGQNANPQEFRWLAASQLWYSELSLLERYGFPSQSLRWSWWESLSVPWFTHRLNLMTRFLPAWIPWSERKLPVAHVDDSGSADFPTLQQSEVEYRRRVAKAHQDYSAQLQGFRLGGHGCQALRDLLAVCRHEKIETALVTMPEGTAFRSWYPPGVWEQIRDYLLDLDREYSSPLIDARSWVADEDFSDSHHLQPHGARVFSERLGQTFLLPWLTSRLGRN